MIINSTPHTPCLDTLRELHARLKAMGLRSHLKVKYGAVYLMDDGLRFLLSERNGVQVLTVGLLVGTDPGTGRIYRDYCFRDPSAEALIGRALWVVGRIRALDNELGAAAVASFQAY